MKTKDPRGNQLPTVPRVDLVSEISFRQCSMPNPLDCLQNQEELMSQASKLPCVRQRSSPDRTIKHSILSCATCDHFQTSTKNACVRQRARASRARAIAFHALSWRTSTMNSIDSRIAQRHTSSSVPSSASAVDLPCRQNRRADPNMRGRRSIAACCVPSQ